MVIERPGQTQVEMYRSQTGGTSEVKTEENDDWRMVTITPPPKSETAKKDLVPIPALPKFAQGAFRTTKHLNQIQSIVF